MELITLERLKSQNLNKWMELSDYVLKASTKNGIVRLRTDWTTMWKHHISTTLQVIQPTVSKDFGGLIQYTTIHWDQTSSTIELAS
jgi:hypothetical protein